MILLYKSLFEHLVIFYFKAFGRGVAEQRRQMTNDRNARMGRALVNESHGHFEHQLSFSRIHFRLFNVLTKTGYYIVAQTSCSLKTL